MGINMTLPDVMKKCCKTCPFKSTTKPFLREERQMELAALTEKRYAGFKCHKTLGYDDEGDTEVISTSQECHGFHVIQSRTTGSPLRVKTEDPEVFDSALDMADNYAGN
jgi:hypothetical protein